MSTADEYLRRVRRHLYAIAPNRRREVLADLRAHFADARELGLPMDEVVANLGSPDEVAERARLEFGGESALADTAWRALVWAAVSAAVVTAAVILFLSPGDLFGPHVAPYAATLSTPVIVAVPVLLAAAALPFPLRMRTVATAAAAVALTFACVIGGIEAGAFFAPSCLLLWTALVTWVRLRGDGFGPFWHLGAALLAIAPAVAIAVTWPAALAGTLRRAAAESAAGFDVFSPVPWTWATLAVVALSAALIAFGIRFGGWMLGVVGGIVMVFALVAGGPLTLGMLGLGGLWLTIGLAHAVATPPRD